MEVLWPVGELVVLSQASVPHKRFLSALVHRRVGVTLPLELDLSLGMRKYSVIFTGKCEAFPFFGWNLGQYMIPDKRVDVADVPSMVRCSTHDVPPEEKGKQL